MRTTFVETNDNLEMSLTMFIPKKYGKSRGSDFDLDKACDNGLALMMDIVGAFASRIITSLEHRMSACQSLLVTHLKDVEYNDGQHIHWRRKDGQYGNFNVPSFNSMQDAVKALKQGCYKEFCTKKNWIDQTLKALLNDVEQDHSDCAGFRYSQLVSILCELQACPQEYMPK